MAYKYIPASLSYTSKKGNDPKNQYLDLFQQTLNDQFYNASNWWTIQEETGIGSQVYANVDVRIAHVINAETGLKLGDDWKTILFKELSHQIELGKYYVFDNSTWLTVNSETVKNLTATCTIRRCNNSLRWIDERTGIYYTEPCCIEYVVKEPRDYATQGSPFITPGGFLHIHTQFNERTNKIKQNQRFLFGNEGHWTCYKVIGTGINDFRNMETFDSETTRVLTFDLVANFVNDELDDIVNGIADVNTSLYAVSLSNYSISGSPTGTNQLTASITYNGNTVDRTIIWESLNTRIVTVSGSGLMTFGSVGTTYVTAGIENNPVSASCAVTVTNTPSSNFEILINPDTNYVLEDESQTYSVYLYENNIQLPDTFTITCNGSNVPSTSYTFQQVTGNSFKIDNLLRDVSSYLVITCTTGSFTPKNANIYLRGMWLNDNI